MDDHLVPLAGDWALRRDFAFRGAGFPVALDAFGTDNEPARLRDIAADPGFREALTWQNRGALANAGDGLLKAGGKPSKQRQPEEIVARYWQRYCAKNDTIGSSDRSPGARFATMARRSPSARVPLDESLHECERRIRDLPPAAVDCQ